MPSRTEIANEKHCKVAEVCRNELFREENVLFDGSFLEDCQQKLLPLTKLFYFNDYFWTRSQGSGQ